MQCDVSGKAVIDIQTASLLPTDTNVERLVTLVTTFVKHAASRIWNEQVMGVIKGAVNVIIDSRITLNVVSLDSIASASDTNLMRSLVDCSDRSDMVFTA